MRPCSTSWQPSRSDRRVREPRLYLGYILLRRGSWGAVLAEYQTAIRLKDDYAEAYFGYGTALSRLGRLEERQRVCLS